MPNYCRNFIPGGTYFFTVALLERNGYLLVKQIDLLGDSVGRMKRHYRFAIHAWEALPDHLHGIWTMPAGDADFATRWRLIKLLFAKRLAEDERRSAVRRKRGERGIWHRRYWEHAIRGERDFHYHFDDVHFNPVKDGWVSRVRDWPSSIFHHYVTSGILPADWPGVMRRRLMLRKDSLTDLRRLGSIARDWLEVTGASPLPRANPVFMVAGEHPSIADHGRQLLENANAWRHHA